MSFPTFTIFSGQTSDGKSVDDAPPPFPGGDGDGKPGVTIPTTWRVLFVNVTINLLAGLVVTTNMSGVKMKDATRMTGDVSFAMHGTVFGWLGPVAPDVEAFDLTTNDPTVPFTATMLDSDGSHDCAAIVEM